MTIHETGQCSAPEIPFIRPIHGASGETLRQIDLGDIPVRFPIKYSVAGRQYIAVVAGQPSIHANTMMGAVAELLGDANSLINLSRKRAAVLVYVLYQITREPE